VVSFAKGGESPAAIASSYASMYFSRFVARNTVSNLK